MENSIITTEQDEKREYKGWTVLMVFYTIHNFSINDFDHKLIPVKGYSFLNFKTWRPFLGPQTPILAVLKNGSQK